MQTLYHRLISSTRKSINATTEGAFLSLKLSDAKAIVEKMASNSTCNEERTLSRKKGGGINHLKEADMVTAKLDLIMKKLDIEKKEVMHINDYHIREVSLIKRLSCIPPGYISGARPPLETLESIQLIHSISRYLVIKSSRASSSSSS